MVEKRPALTFLAYAILTLGVVIVALPVYVTFVASTQTFDQIVSVPMSLVPGTHLIENYKQALTSGSAQASSAPVGRMMLVSLVMALTVAQFRYVERKVNY